MSYLNKIMALQPVMATTPTVERRTYILTIVPFSKDS